MTEPEWMDDWREHEKRKPVLVPNASEFVCVTSFGEIKRGEPGFEEVYIDMLEGEIERLRLLSEGWLDRFKRWFGVTS